MGLRQTYGQRQSCCFDTLSVRFGSMLSKQAELERDGIRLNRHRALGF
jgi:hypothetical protein